MVLQSLGTQTADWITKNPITYGTVAGRRDRGIAFVITQPGPPVMTRNQYIVVTATLNYDIGVFETPLEAKWFPAGNGLLLVVAIPNLDAGLNVDVSLNLFPKEFKPGSRLVDTIQAEVFFEDDFLVDVVVPMA